VHRFFNLFLGGTGREIEEYVKGIELEKITVLPIGRAGAHILVFPVGAFPLNAGGRRVFGDFVGVGGDIENNPMVVNPLRAKGFGDIGVVVDEDEAFGLGGKLSKFKGRIDISPLAGIDGGDDPPFAEGWTCDLHVHLSFEGHYRVFWRYSKIYYLLYCY